MLVLESSVLSTNPAVYSYWHQLLHSDLVEILGLQWAMDTDYETAYNVDEKLLVYAYFRTND